MSPLPDHQQCIDRYGLRIKSAMTRRNVHAISRVKASWYFAADFAITSSGRRGAGGVLSQGLPLMRTASSQSRTNCFHQNMSIIQFVLVLTVREASRHPSVLRISLVNKYKWAASTGDGSKP